MKRYWIGKDTPGSEVPPTSGEMVAVYLASDVDRLREEARERVLAAIDMAGGVGLHDCYTNRCVLANRIIAGVFKEVK